LVIEFETNQGLKSGSSVIEVSQTDIPKAFYVTGYASTAPRARGEAVFVDLGQGRNVVGLLGLGPTATVYPGIEDLSRLAFGFDDNRAYKELATLTGRRDLTSDLLPTLVTLPDPKNAKSAIVVTTEDLPKVVGPDVRFSRAWIEMTNDPVTHKLKNHLPELVERSNWSDRIYSYHGKFTPQYYMFVRT